MLFAGIPQLSTPDDIAYLRRAFSVNMTDAEASDFFKKLIDSAIASKATQLNNLVHLMAHPD
jgi:hypothetical protein